MYGSKKEPLEINFSVFLASSSLLDFKDIKSFIDNKEPNRHLLESYYSRQKQKAEAENVEISHLL